MDAGDLDASDAPFEPPLALASLSGESDADWARAGAPYAGAAFLGGIALDDASQAAARDLVARDRTEFLPDDPVEWIDVQLRALADVDVRAGVNVRATSARPVREAARVCARHDAILEVNAHCRQAELCAVGCGETLLADTERLREYVAAAVDGGADAVDGGADAVDGGADAVDGGADAGAERAGGEELVVSVKVRAEVDGVDLPATARAVADAGATVLHVDAMDSEYVVADVVDAAPELFVVANNEVRDEASVREYLEYGADAVSVGRPSTDPVVLERVARALERVQAAP